MMLKKARKPINSNMAFNFEDHKKIEAFVALLAQIDKRISATGKETKKTKMKKAKDTLFGQSAEKARKNAGPSFS